MTRQKFEARYKGDENIDTVEFNRRPVQFLFQDGDTSTFMDKETFEQYMLNTEDIANELRYLGEDLDGILAGRKIGGQDDRIGIRDPFSRLPARGRRPPSAARRPSATRRRPDSMQ